jgi:hypothetical protein
MVTEDAGLPLTRKPPFPKFGNKPDPTPNFFGIQLSGFVIFKVFTV